MKLNELLRQIDENQKLINSFGQFDESVLKKINYKFRLDWNYYSNKMEGGTLTREETRTVMVGNITVGGKPIKDVMEMKGHDNVVLDILKISKGKLRISEKRIKQIHKAIMHEDDSDKSKWIGEWKTVPNELINYKDEKISFTPPQDVEEEIHQLLNKTNSSLDKIFGEMKNAPHPLIVASDFHLDFVTIHPFYDGNGRTTRILTNLILISCGLPVIIIKEKYKDIYYQYLADIQVYGGDKNLFYEFMADRVIESQKLILEAIEGKDIEEPEDLDKKLSLFEKELSVFDEDYDVKWHLSYDVVIKMFNNWIKELALEMIPVAQKFNKYYIKSNHYIGFNRFGNAPHFSDEPAQKIIDELNNSIASYDQSRGIYDLEFMLRFQYGDFKKGGLNPFSCNYGFTIKFESSKYKYFQEKFIENENVTVIAPLKYERLLHKPITHNEIKQLVKEMGETLLEHMKFHSNKMLGNK